MDGKTEVQSTLMHVQCIYLPFDSKWGIIPAVYYFAK